MASSQINGLDTPPHEISVMGPTGNGKSSFMRAIPDAHGPITTERHSSVVGHVRQSATRIPATHQAAEMRANSRPTGTAVSRMNDTDTQPIAIAVLGPTGAGKSSFIRAITATDDATESNAPVVGHSLRSCTAAIQAVQTTVDGRACVLIDTPGYDDTTRSDAEILRETATYLEEILRVGCRLTGVIYMHRITDNRLGGGAARNLRMFEALCGLHAMPNVVICSTMWDLLEDESVGEARERELCAGFWTRMLDAGAHVRRLDGSREHALAAVRELIPRLPVTLRIQDELVRQGLKLSDTAAGKEVGNELARAIEAHKEEIERLQRELSNAQARDINGIHEEIAKEHRALRAREKETRRLHERRDEELQDLRRRVENLHNRQGPLDLVFDIARRVVALARYVIPMLDAGGLGAGRRAR